MTTAVDDPIVVRGLRKSYGPFHAVSDVNLTVHRGEVFALLGPNGAGKTTTVEILEGVRPRDSGDVSVLGEDPAKDRRSWRARVGVVPQSTGAYAELTVKEVVGHFATMYANPLPVDQVIEMVGLTQKRKNRAMSLSGGQQRRLDVAVGVIGDPELIFLDEPTTGLDPKARHEAWDLVRFFADRGTTTVLTTHYLDEAEALAARAAVIVAGSVIACAPMAELGGRGSTKATVNLRPAQHLIGEAMSVLGPDATADAAGILTLKTLTPTTVLGRLLSWAAARDIQEIPGLRVHQPTLEEIYLDLIKVDTAALEEGRTTVKGRTR